jgi:hypothetical protein
MIANSSNNDLILFLGEEKIVGRLKIRFQLELLGFKVTCEKIIERMIADHAQMMQRKAT